MAPDPPARVRRFSAAERALHWLLAGSFFVMLGSGLVLYLPSLSGLVARPTAKAWHIDAALALGAGAIALLLAHWRTFHRTFPAVRPLRPGRRALAPRRAPPAGAPRAGSSAGPLQRR